MKQRSKKGIYKSLAIVFAVIMLLQALPVMSATGASTKETISGGKFNGYTVCIRPVGASSTLSVKNNGKSVGQDPVHLFNTGDSSRFYLTKADTDSYYIRFFDGADRYTPSTKYLDIDNKGGYDKAGNVIHVVTGNTTATNKRWIFIRQADGTYWIQNKRSKQYWALQKPGNYADGNKLVQSKKAQKWELEIIETKASPILTPKIKAYDSYTFVNKAGKTVTACDWMTRLPDKTSLSDISIPGTHDSATAHVDSLNNIGQCQNLSIKDQMNCGVRYFDMRLGSRTISGKKTLVLVHGITTAQYSGSTLTFAKALSWIDSFLKANPGETIILQVKEDRNSKATEQLAYNYLKSSWNSRLYKGDHVPTLKEIRGKVVLLSRLVNYRDSNFKSSGNAQWALDVHNWKTSTKTSDGCYTSALVTSGKNYEVWSQDDYSHSKTTKFKYINGSVFHDKYGAEARIKAAAKKGKKALVVSYSSATNLTGNQFPQEIARYINPILKNYLKNWLSKAAVKRLGIICSDFSDEQLTSLVYRNNFK